MSCIKNPQQFLNISHTCVCVCVCVLNKNLYGGSNTVLYTYLSHYIGSFMSGAEIYVISINVVSTFDLYEIT